MIGQIVNYRYEVLEKIGDGDIFSVYRSRDKVLNRLVALKAVQRGFADNHAFTTALRAGYQAAAVLDHPCIARVLEADPASAEPYVVCEYVHGINVKDRIRRAGAFQVPLALDIIIRVLEGLEYAHANRILHGDLRPQDIIVTPDGDVEITDFGLYAALRRSPEVADRVAMRSVHYEAPEIAEGAAPSVSSDLYSVGVILYEMLTGVLPFEGATAVAVALKQAKETPAAPRAVNAGVPTSLSEVVMTAIDRDPQNRFSSAAAMLAELRAIRDAMRVGKPLSATPTARQVTPDYEREREPEGNLKKSLIWLIALFVVVVLASLGATMFIVGGHAQVRVPPLIGKTFDEAVYEAQKAGLEVEEDGEVFSNTCTAGRVCSMTPMEGTIVARDSVIKVKISKGPSAQRVPDVTGMTETDAHRRLGEAQFTVGKVTGQYSDTIPLHSVISQKPEGGEMSSVNATVDLVVSLGPKPETVTGPDDDTPTGQQRRFDVAVEVPADADGSQEVRIVVEDERGEITAYQSYHEPGSKFSEPVTTYGSDVRIRIYVGDDLISDSRY